MNTEVSIRRTLLTYCGIGLCLASAILSLSIYFLVRRGLFEELDQSIMETASILANQMEYEHGEIIFEWQEGLGTNSKISDQALFQYWNEKSGLTTRSPALGSMDLPKFSADDGRPALKTVNIPNRPGSARAIGMVIYPYVIPSENLDLKSRGEIFHPKDYPHTLVVARDLTPVLRILNYLAASLATSTLLALFVGFFVIRAAVNLSLAPLEKLTHQVRDRSENQLDAAIILPGSLPSELIPLAESFDILLSRVAAIRSRERDFIRHASHELRTPIASLVATTELALSRNREAAEYKLHLETCAKTSSDLASLVQRLSALSRIGSKSGSAQPAPLDLSQILAESLQTFGNKAEDANLAIACSKSGSSKVLADPVLTALVINNLVDNAISYSPPGSTLDIAMENGKSSTRLSFTNPSEDLPRNLERLFEPLFRRDSSRTRNIDSHLGIGLTLSREAAQAMQGTLTASRSADGRISFTFSLPNA